LFFFVGSHYLGPNITYDPTNPNGYYVSVEKSIQHPDYYYDGFTVMVNDVGLLKLRTPVIGIPFVNLVDVQKVRGALVGPSLPTPGQTIKVAGFGAVHRGPPHEYPTLKDYPYHLMEVELLVVPNSEYPARQDVEVSPYQFTPNSPPQGTCFGDSGGPMLLQDPVTLSWFQVGITSLGPLSCHGHDVAFRVSTAVGWIASVLVAEQSKILIDATTINFNFGGIFP